MVKTIILIPAYKPETKMLDLLEALRGKSSSLSGGDRAGNSDNQIDGIVVVDDGGQEAYRDLFAKAEDMGCLVVHHEVNRGKGAAIRTGIRFAMEHFGEEIRIVTADADGQHTPEDILRVAGQVKANDSSAKPVLVLGVRDLSGIDVPARSMLGNRITALCFRISTGISCADTQTGLRGISAGLLPLALSVDGDRYDYEMNFLTEAVRRARLIQIPIRTVYEEGNKTSHFRPVRDSLLIYRKPIRYMAVGAGSAVVDWSLFLLIMGIFHISAFDGESPAEVGTVAAGIIAGASGAAAALARIGSGIFNFTVNRNWSFQSRGNAGREFVRYLILFGANMVANAAAVSIFSYTGLPAALGKFLADVGLFVINYQVQKRWVFARK